MENSITYIGLDVHKDTIAVALAEPGRRGEVREYGKIANTPAALRALLGKLTRRGGILRFCYGASPPETDNRRSGSGRLSSSHPTIRPDPPRQAGPPQVDGASCTVCFMD